MNIYIYIYMLYLKMNIYVIYCAVYATYLFFSVLDGQL